MGIKPEKKESNKKIPFPIVVEEILTPEELVTWNRIKGEPN